MSSLWKGVFSRLLFLGGVVLNFGCFGMGRDSPYSVKANATILNLPTVLPPLPPSDLVEGIRVPRGPPYLSVLDV